MLIAHGRTLDGLATGVTSAMRDLAEAFWPGALTIVCRAQPTLTWDLGDESGRSRSGCRCTRSRWTCSRRPGRWRSPSANRPGTEHAGPPLTYDDAWAALSTQVDVYLDAGRLSRPASTVVDGSDPDAPPKVLRLGAVGLDTLRAVVADIDASVVEPAGPEPARPEPAGPEPVEREAAG